MRKQRSRRWCDIDQANKAARPVRAADERASKSAAILIQYYHDKAAKLAADIEQYAQIDTSIFPSDELQVYQSNLYRMRQKLQVYVETYQTIEKLTIQKEKKP